MGNNPVGMVDPDGGYSWLVAWWRSGFNSDLMTKSGTEWGVKRETTVDYNGKMIPYWAHDFGPENGSLDGFSMPGIRIWAKGVEDFGHRAFQMGRKVIDIAYNDMMDFFGMMTKSGPSSRTNPDASRRTLNPKDGGDRMSDVNNALSRADRAEEVRRDTVALNPIDTIRYIYYNQHGMNRGAVLRSRLTGDTVADYHVGSGF